MNRILQSISLCAAVVAAGVFLPQVVTAQSAAKKAPAFSGMSSTGKTISLDSLRATKRPTLLYFIGHTCPVNNQAVKFYNSLADAHKGKVNLVGIINTDKAGYDRWQARHKSPYQVVFDPSMKIIGAYEAQRSPWTVLVDAQGNIVESWPGYCVKTLNEMNASMARLAKTKVPKIETAGAPENTRFG